MDCPKCIDGIMSGQIPIGDPDLPRMLQCDSCGHYEFEGYTVARCLHKDRVDEDCYIPSRCEHLGECKVTKGE